MVDRTAAKRQRRRRDRARRGVRVVGIEITWDDLDAFDTAGLLAWNENDPGEIADAVRIVLDEWRDRPPRR